MKMKVVWIAALILEVVVVISILYLSVPREIVRLPYVEREIAMAPKLVLRANNSVTTVSDVQAIFAAYGPQILSKRNASTDMLTYLNITALPQPVELDYIDEAGFQVIENVSFAAWLPFVPPNTEWRVRNGTVEYLSGIDYVNPATRQSCYAGCWIEKRVNATTELWVCPWGKFVGRPPAPPYCVPQEIWLSGALVAYGIGSTGNVIQSDPQRLGIPIAYPVFE